METNEAHPSMVWQIETDGGEPKKRQALLLAGWEPLNMTVIAQPGAELDLSGRPRISLVMVFAYRRLTRVAGAVMPGLNGSLVEG